MRKIVEGVKDATGSFLPPAKPEVNNSPLSIDGILHDGLINIRRIMDRISVETLGHPTKDTVAMLKDCVSMLMALQKEEKAILNNMSIEDLKKMISKKK